MTGVAPLITLKHTEGPLTKAPRMGKARGKIKNQDDPRGQLAAFLRDWIDRKHGGDANRLAKSLGVSVRTIRYWATGQKSPQLADLNKVASALGYRDWSKLAAAVVKFGN